MLSSEHPGAILLKTVRIALAVVWAILPVPGLASPDPAALCDRAAERASRETGVPLSVLMAITRVESGRSRSGALAPWPWTVNMEGAGRWFDSEKEARAYVDASRARGARSFDVGCFQINHLWHGKAFASIEAMFDPETNARYAAQFLSALFRDTGSWTAAAGAYHSRTPELSNRYAARFQRVHDALVAAGAPSDTAAGPAAAPPPRMTGTAPEATEAAPQDAINPFPLLLAGETRGRGSLVPLAEGGAMPLFSAEPRALY